MFRTASFLIIHLILITFLSSCSTYQKTLKGTDNDKKYDEAIKYYESGDYYRAQQLFDQLIPVLRGTDKAEKIHYFYGYTYYNQREYTLASYYFKRFSKSFPTSVHAEECAYLAAYCKFLESPNYSLDQTTTYEAITELQLFINMYPASERVIECNKLIDQLRLKLEEKAYRISRLYLKMEEYKAAIQSYNTLLKEFPATKYKESIMFDLVKANYHYAEKSIISKKKERYLSAVEAYDKLAAAYPESSYLQEAREIRDDIMKNNLN